MEQALTGDFHNLDVTESTTVAGAVHGAVVRSGAALTVNGTIDGDIALEDGAVLSANGVFAPRDIANDGVIMAAGMVEVDPGRDDDAGRFAVSPGSLLESARVLQRDGSLRTLEEHGSDLTVDGSTYCAWIATEARFVSESELKAARGRSDS